MAQKVSDQTNFNHLDLCVTAIDLPLLLSPFEIRQQGSTERRRMLPEARGLVNAATRSRQVGISDLLQSWRETGAARGLRARVSVRRIEDRGIGRAQRLRVAPLHVVKQASDAVESLFVFRHLLHLRLRKRRALLKKVLLARLSVESLSQVAIKRLEVFEHSAALLVISEAKGRDSILPVCKLVREGDRGLNRLLVCVLEHALLILDLFRLHAVPRAERLGELASVEDVLAEDIGAPCGVQHILADVSRRSGGHQPFLRVERAVSARLPIQLFSVEILVGREHVRCEDLIVAAVVQILHLVAWPMALLPRAQFGLVGRSPETVLGARRVINYSRAHVGARWLRRNLAAPGPLADRL